MDYIKRAYKADISELDKITDDLGEILNKHGVSMMTVYDLSTAIEEIFSHIVSYAYMDKENKYVQIDMTFDEGDVIIDFIDEGEETDFSDSDDVPSVEKIARSLIKPLIEHCIDDCHYERVNGRNIFTIIKKIKEN